MRDLPGQRIVFVILPNSHSGPELIFSWICPLATGSMVSLNAELEVFWASHWEVQVLNWELLFSFSFTMAIKNNQFTVHSLHNYHLHHISKILGFLYKPISCSNPLHRRVYIIVMLNMPGIIMNSLITTKTFYNLVGKFQNPIIRVFFLGPFLVPIVLVWFHQKVDPEANVQMQVVNLGIAENTSRVIRKWYREENIVKSTPKASCH